MLLDGSDDLFICIPTELHNEFSSDLVTRQMDSSNYWGKSQEQSPLFGIHAEFYHYFLELPKLSITWYVLSLSFNKVTA